MVKQRRDSIAQFEAGKREDLAAIERAEIAVLQGYLPQPLTDAEIDALIAEAIARHRRRRHGRHGQGDGGAEAEARRPRRHGRRLGAGSRPAWPELSIARGARPIPGGDGAAWRPFARASGCL